MTFRHYLLAASALSGLAVLTGCISAPAAEAPQDSTKFTVENTDQFAPLDGPTESAVACTGLQERMLADGRLEVVANVKNRRNDPFRVQLQCVFLDDQGMTTEAQGAWQSVEIAGGATDVVRFTASNTAAKRYSIRARMAR